MGNSKTNWQLFDEHLTARKALLRSIHDLIIEMSKSHGMDITLKAINPGCRVAPDKIIKGLAHSQMPDLGITLPHSMHPDETIVFRPLGTSSAGWVPRYSFPVRILRNPFKVQVMKLAEYFRNHADEKNITEAKREYSFFKKQQERWRNPKGYDALAVAEISTSIKTKSKK